MNKHAAAITLLCLLAAYSRAAADDVADFFESDIRPLLVEHCLDCHSGDAPEAGLRMTSRAALLQGGQSGPAIVAGRPQDSRLIAAVQHRGRIQMPPEGKLSDSQIAALSRWIERGAPWPAAALPPAPGGERSVAAADRDHWSFRPIASPQPPEVNARHWPQSAMDRFVLARLEAAELTPAQPADRRTLLRRAYYDITGLPPTWDEVQAFAEDERPTGEAFQQVIDRLLASPGYGERWGRHWLDVARFADTKDGVLMYGDDRIRPYAYTYRDYVIRALNEDLPFDRFVCEQLAADLIEPAVEPWRLAAMGFLTLGRQYDSNIHDVIDDRIDTVTRGLLGLTVACARCHDHKYDPIPTADYYSLYGVFAASEAPLELPLVEPPENVPGGVEFEQQAAAKRAELQQFLDAQFELLNETARQRTGDYLVHVVTTDPDPLETAIYFLSLAADDLRPPIIARWRNLIRQRATPGDPVFGPWHDLMRLADGSQDAAAVRPGEPETFAAAAAAVLERWSSRPLGIRAGEVNPLVLHALQAATLTGFADVARAYGDLLTKVSGTSNAPDVATGTAAVAGDDDARRQLLRLVVGSESPAWFPRSETRKYMSRQQKDEFGGKLLEIDRMAVKSPHAPPRAMVLYDSAVPYEPHVFVRGNPSRRGPSVPRQFPAIATLGERAAFSDGSGRLDLAREIMARENPLAARVFVNRVWMHHFGEPLVGTPSDFGTRSTPPTHPELLDHLASRLRDEGWSIKRLHRRVLQSSVYQQASLLPSEFAGRGAAVDPGNRLYWRANRRRLEFEAMRDTLLAVSGRLQHRAGGRPVDVAGNPHCRERTVYGLVDRQSLPGVFRAFDFPSPDQTVERRPRTMVPQQALFAMNSAFMVEQAQALAARSANTGATDPAARVVALYRSVFARAPEPAELAACRTFLATAADEQSKLSSWEQLAQVLLSSNELMYVD